jgi:hypothetical protein
MRTTEEASFVASMILGGLIWWWLLLFIELLDLRKYVPKEMIMILMVCSLIFNIVIFNKCRRYQKIVAILETNTYPMIYHILAYILFFWTIAGAVIIARV